MRTGLSTLLTKIGIFFTFGVIIGISSCGTNVNTVQDPSFDKSGYYIDSLKPTFEAKAPKALGFFVEVSGSMNGFFRSNRATQFKKDIWSIVSNFGNQEVFILSNSGTIASQNSIADFRRSMNSGTYISNQETLVPTMIKSILDNLDYNNGEVGVLISDMKYSPERQRDVQVLLTQYQTDVRNVIGKYPDIAVCIICATSDYLASNGAIAESESPYYYVIFGKDECVAYMRNRIATILEDNGSYKESIEMGFDYKSPSYSFGIPKNALQLGTEPTFIGYDVYFSDTCTVKLKLDLSDYRWTIADESVLRNLLNVKAIYGSNVSVGDIKVDVDNHYQKEFLRKATAIFDLKVYDMYAAKSDVIEWSLNHPEYQESQWFSNVISANSERDLSGSFSMDKFIGGCFNAIQNHWDSTPNKILISKSK